MNLPVLKVYFLAFVPIFVAVDPLGMIPAYLGLTHRMRPADRNTLVRNATLTALAVAIIFLWVGRMVFRWLGITISDFLVAGGAVLFIISIRDLLLSYGKGSDLPDKGVGIVPLAVPLMVGPAVLTTSLVLLGSFGFLPTLASIVVNLLLCAGVLHFSPWITKVLGEAGSNTISKLANLLLAAIGVMLMRRGLLEILSGWFRAMHGGA